MRHGQDQAAAPAAAQGRAAEFEGFMREGEPRLRRALVAAYGFEDGRDATAEALAYVWEHWERLRAMPNAMGYLFRVGQSSRRHRREPVLYDVSGWPDHLFEPGLPGALAALSRRQRMVVVLVHGFGYTLHEVAELIGMRRTRAAGRRRTLVTVAAAGVATAGCAAGLAVALASPGAPSRPAAQASPSSTSSHGSAFLTAATVRQMASASRSALANSGREQISYRSVKNGVVTTAGTDTVTYSGSDYNYAVHQTVPAFPDGVARVVHGQFYLKGDPRQPWLHQLGEDTSPQFPEAATLLRLLSPAADFKDAGTDVIGGTRLTRLHATRLSGLPEAPTLGRYANLTAYAKSATVPPGTLTALDVWVDSHDVVHQMKIQLLGSDGQTTLTVNFTDSGQPQSITAPATSNPVPASS